MSYIPFGPFPDCRLAAAERDIDRFTGEELFDEYAWNLMAAMQKQLHANYRPDYERGIAGIGVGIDYLIRSGLIEVDGDLSIGYIFNITSIEDLEESENIIETYEIEKYKMTPIYTKNNIQFFKDNVFLRKDDILSAHLSMRDLFRRRLINENDFGRIHVLGNGDVHANMNHPKIANIYVDTIGEIIQKEINEGRSWLRTRNQYPCDKCLYQDICPSPSDYEIILGHPNLCHVHNV